MCLYERGSSSFCFGPLSSYLGLFPEVLPAASGQGFSLSPLLPPTSCPKSVLPSTLPNALALKQLEALHKLQTNVRT